MKIKEIKTVRGVSLKLDKVERNRLEVLNINKSFIISAKLVAANLDVIKAMVDGKPFNGSVKRAYKGFFGNISKAYVDNKLDEEGLAMLDQVKTNKELFKILTTTKKVKSLSEAILKVQEANAPKDVSTKKSSKEVKKEVKSPLEISLELVKDMSQKEVAQIKASLKGVINAKTLNSLKPEQIIGLNEALKSLEII